MQPADFVSVSPAHERRSFPSNRFSPLRFNLSWLYSLVLSVRSTVSLFRVHRLDVGHATASFPFVDRFVRCWFVRPAFRLSFRDRVNLGLSGLRFVACAS